MTKLKLFKFLLLLNPKKRLNYKDNTTKYRILSRKPQSHDRILMYRTWHICPSLRSEKPTKRQLTKVARVIKEAVTHQVIHCGIMVRYIY